MVSWLKMGLFSGFASVSLLNRANSKKRQLSTMSRVGGYAGLVSAAKRDGDVA